MSYSTNSDSIEDELIFYVNEEGDGDEFTFYLDCGSDKTVVERLKNKLPESVRTALASGSGKEMFSFAERVFVKNLILTKDSLKWSKDRWPKLTSDGRAIDLHTSKRTTE